MIPEQEIGDKLEMKRFSQIFREEDLKVKLLPPPPLQALQFNCESPEAQEEADDTTVLQETQLTVEENREQAEEHEFAVPDMEPNPVTVDNIQEAPELPEEFQTNMNSSAVASSISAQMDYAATEATAGVGCFQTEDSSSDSEGYNITEQRLSLSCGHSKSSSSSFEEENESCEDIPVVLLCLPPEEHVVESSAAASTSLPSSSVETYTRVKRLDSVQNSGS